MDYATELTEKGFVVLPAMFEPAALEEGRILAAGLHLENGKCDPFERYLLPHRAEDGVFYDCFQRHPEVRSILLHDKLLDEIESLLGGFFLFENSLVDKVDQTEVPFHQDFLNLPTKARRLIVWVPLAEVTENDGPLVVIPGSHKGGYRQWKRVRGATHNKRLSITKDEGELCISIPMRAGDVLIFDPMLVHGSGPSHSGHPRPALRFAVQSLKEIYVPRGSPLVLRGGRPDQLHPNSAQISGLERLASRFGGWFVRRRVFGSRRAR